MNHLENKEALLNYTKCIHQKFEHSEVVNPSYYEPGMMENMDQYEGLFDSVTNIVTLRVDSKGLRYENRTSKLDNLSIGDDIAVCFGQQMLKSVCVEREVVFFSCHEPFSLISQKIVVILPSDADHRIGAEVSLNDFF